MEEEVKELELATIFKRVSYDVGDGFVPVDVVMGYFDEENSCFVDLDGTSYYHIIDEPENLGFADRENLEEVRQDYLEDILEKNDKEIDVDNLDQVNSEEVEERIQINDKLLEEIDYKICEDKLHDAEKYVYQYFDPEATNVGAPIILYKEEKDNTLKVFLDGDVVTFYYYQYEDFFNEVFEMAKDKDNKKMIEAKTNDNKTKNLKEIQKQINVNKLFKEITSQVIDQDSPIRKILNAIWKQYNGFSDTISRNILINGSTGVGKTQTFRILSKLIDVPCVITSATEYTATGYVGKSVSDMLISLVRKADFDIEKAERGILIIDEIDKLSETNKNSSQVNQRDVQEALLKILEDGVFDLVIDHETYQFDTSKLLIVGMGSWSRIDLTPDKVMGFEKQAEKKTYKDISREDIVNNGIIPELVGRFPVLVQMNELNFDSFVRILKSKNNALSLNKEFFLKNGVKLTVKKDAYEAIAEKAMKNNYGARGLDEIVETALSVASYEIASNPNKYSELIISKDTIENNESYKLVKKIKNNKKK